jgi:ribosome-associated protein YbcJ (S4-like RNA binding protein)
LSVEKINLKDLIAKTSLIDSNAEAKRLIRAGAVEVNGVVESDLMKEFNVNDLESIRMGKRQWLKFID